MELPSLDELNLDDDLTEFMDKSETKEKKAAKKRTSKVKSKSKSKPENADKAKDDNEAETRESGKLKIPKTRYDNEGNPILSIPDLDDVDLTNELDRFFD